MNRPHLLPILMTTGAALLWASSFTVVKVGLRYIDPYSFVLLRFAVAAAILLVLVLLTGKRNALAECLRDRYVFLLGMILSASFGLQFRGQTETTAAKAAMIVNSSVVLVAPLSVLFLKEHMGRRKLVALAVGLLGVYLIVGGRSGNGSQAVSLSGDLLISGSAFAYALYVVVTKITVNRRRFDEIPLITGVFIWSLPVFLISALPSIPGSLSLARDTWLAVCYLAIFCSVLPFLIWTAAIKHIGAMTSAIVLLAELVFGVLFAHVLLGELISGQILAGCALICGGIVTVGLKS